MMIFRVRPHAETSHKTGRQNSSVCIEMCIELHSQKLPKQALSYTLRYTRSLSSGTRGLFTKIIIYVIKMLITHLHSAVYPDLGMVLIPLGQPR